MYLVLVRSVGERLVMQQLYYADEIREIDEIPVGGAEPKAGEIQLALQLLEQNASETFEPKKYEDEAKQRIEEAIQRKVEGQEVALAPTEQPAAQIIDLMEALKASLAQKKPAGAAPDSSDEERRPARRAAKPAAEAAGEGAEESAPRSRRAASAKTKK
jgi:DNA end-binding protein Ku